MKKPSRFPVDSDAIMDKLVATAKAYGVKGMAQDINKRYITLSNELREAEYAKLGFRSALDILDRGLRPEAEEDAQIAARKVVEMFCEKLGFVAFRIPAPSGSTCADVFGQTARVSREYSESVRAVADAVADGRLDQKELAQLRRENRELIEACLETDALYHKLERGIE